MILMVHLYNNPSSQVYAVGLVVTADGSDCWMAMEWLKFFVYGLNMAIVVVLSREYRDYHELDIQIMD